MAIDWHTLALVFIKTSAVYWSIIFGIKLLGCRALGQLGPQEFILIALLTKTHGRCDYPQKTGTLG